MLHHATPCYSATPQPWHPNLRSKSSAGDMGNTKSTLLCMTLWQLILKVQTYLTSVHSWYGKCKKRTCSHSPSFDASLNPGTLLRGWISLWHSCIPFWRRIRTRTQQTQSNWRCGNDIVTGCLHALSLWFILVSSANQVSKFPKEATCHVAAM